MKKDKVEVKCIGMSDEAKGIVKYKGKDIAIPNLIQGEKAMIEVTQHRDFFSGVVTHIGEVSKDRVMPPCPYYSNCGGCQLQHISNQGQSAFKQDLVDNLLGKYHTVNKLLTMETPYNYRNKSHSTFSRDKKGNSISGIYEENTHRIVPVKRCMIQEPRVDAIISTIREMMKPFKLSSFDEDTGQGFLRHVLIKTGFISNQIMVVFITSTPIFPGKNNFVKALLKKHPEITTMVMNINDRKTSVVLGNTEKILYGKGYIEDTLCGCVFQISPKSFYQINPIQTEVLYNKAIEMAKLKGDETILDAYCGIGTIGLIASKKAKNVIGVELNKDAVKDAIRNAKRNHITNAYFYNDDAGRFMNQLTADKQPVDVVFMDPPRSGSDEKFLTALVKLAPKTVVYISCNPVTQEHDLAFLTNIGYQVTEIQPVDMFPQTYHVETVCLLTRK
jgi:23S rRNA (uracil1939-C5)-methyltransferase